jgi:hypothetical protein
MCLTVEKFKIEIAQEDIVVYKVLEKYGGHIISPYCRFLYEIGKEYKTIIEPRLSRNQFQESYYEINEGFHSFLYEEDAKDEKMDFQYGKFKDWDFRCFRCIIPKGSKIVYGTYGAKDAIVSEEIKIIEEIEL